MEAFSQSRETGRGSYLHEDQTISKKGIAGVRIKY